MRIVVSTLAAATLVAAVATVAMPADAAPRDRDRSKVQGSKGYGYNTPKGQTGDCVVTGWTDWSLTKPIFKCPGDEQPSRSDRRR